MFRRKIVLVVISLIDLNLFWNQDFLSSLYLRANISFFLYPNKASHILKSKRKEGSTTFLLYVLMFKEVYIVRLTIEYLA
jgi:hypothetical protein